jgi:hypothetical protein
MAPHYQHFERSSVPSGFDPPFSSGVAPGGLNPLAKIVAAVARGW